jgi:hypothetical protein
MTCLIATFSGVWADRRVTGTDAARYTPARKILRGTGLVAGFCGDDSACSKAFDAVRKGETDVAVLAALCEGVLVDRRGRWELWDGVAVRVPKRVPVAAHGTGCGPALAFLAGRGKYDNRAVRDALRYVSTVRTDCGDGVDYLALRSR